MTKEHIEKIITAEIQRTGCAGTEYTHIRNIAAATKPLQDQLAAAQAALEIEHEARMAIVDELAAAQAVIVRKNAYLKTAMEGAFNDKLRNSAREGLAITADTKAFDAAVTAATKPI